MYMEEPRQVDGLVLLCQIARIRIQLLNMRGFLARGTDTILEK
jgi:hypothetical protein